jgi:hypothetical protein
MLKKSGTLPVRAHTLWIYAAIIATAGLLLLLDSQTARTDIPVLGAAVTWNLFHPRSAGDEAAKIWQEKDYVAMNRRFEAVDTSFPTELIKAIAWCESEWNHLDQTGKVFHTVNYHPGPDGGWQTSLDWGLMQINERMESLNRKVWDLERIKTDPEYNLRAGVAVLEGKRAYIRSLRRRKDWKAIEARFNLKGHSELEITLKAYNGFRRSWSYLYRINTALNEKPWEKAMLQQMLDQARRPDISLGPAGDCAWRLLPGDTRLGLRATGWEESQPAAPAPGVEPYYYCLDLTRP